MKRFFPIALTFLCGIGVASAEVVTTTTCQIGNGPITSNPTNCSFNTPSAAPSANASITLNQLTPVPGAGSLTSFSLDVAGSARAVPFVPASPTTATTTAQAASTANIDYLFSTSGPVRQGVITTTASVRNLQRGAGNDSANATVSVGSLSGSCAPSGDFCQGLLGPLGSYSNSFTLGTTFAFRFSEAFQATGTFIDGTGFANGAVSFNFQLLEADGRTPVAFSAVPEPSAFSLLALAGPLAWLYRRRASRA